MKASENLKLLIAKGNYAKIKDLIGKMHPYDATILLKELDAGEIPVFMQALNDDMLANIFSYLDEEEAKIFLEKANPSLIAKIIVKMEADDAADLVKKFSPEERKKIASLIDEDAKKDIKELSQYDESMTGAIMSNNFLTIGIADTVGDAMKKLVREASDREVIDTLFVVDGESRLKGTVDLKKLIIARKNENISDICDYNYVYAGDTDAISSSVNKLKEYNLLVLPILKDKVLKGIVTIDDVIDVVDRETSDDYDKLAGLAGKNDSAIKTVLKSRIPWLVILLILSFFVSSLLGAYQEIIGKVIPLVFFQSLILDMGGNSGTQSLASSVVGLAKNELDKKSNIRHHLGKEALAGLINGVILGILAFLLTFVFMWIKKDDPLHKVALISTVIAISMAFGIFCADFIGSVIPIILHKCKLDPAVASGPFITTLNDILSVVIYYSLASLILSYGGVPL